MRLMTEKTPAQELANEAERPPQSGPAALHRKKEGGLEGWG
jgi:hypothetical protein